jgi:hypothetical protein
MGGDIFGRELRGQLCAFAGRIGLKLAPLLSLPAGVVGVGGDVGWVGKGVGESGTGKLMWMCAAGMDVGGTEKKGRTCV